MFDSDKLEKDLTECVRVGICLTLIRTDRKESRQLKRIAQRKRQRERERNRGWGREGKKQRGREEDRERGRRERGRRR